jgi:hypothetical protein
VPPLCLGVILSNDAPPPAIGKRTGSEYEVASLMSENGDMNVSANMALDIVDGGGFVVLMDAFNEDRQPQAALSFVRRARKRKLAVMSSRSSPSWPQKYPDRTSQSGPVWT